MSGEETTFENELAQAVTARTQHLRSQAESLTLQAIRRLLENDMGLEERALDVHKKLITRLVDKVLTSQSESTSKENAVEVQENDGKEQPEETQQEEDSKGATNNQVTGDKLDEKSIKNAISKRADYLRNEAQTLTVQQIRRVLEKDLNIAEFSLDGKKSLIRKLIDEILSATESSPSIKKTQKTKIAKQTPQGKGKKEEVGVHQQKKRKADNTKIIRDKKVPKNKNKLPESSESDAVNESDESNDDVHSDKKPAKQKVLNAKPAQNKQVERLKQTIKACGMGIPPSIYKKVKQAPESKQDDMLIKELESMLQREGLTANASEKEIKAVRKRIEKRKDLEGIDVTNIISDRHDRRRASTFYDPVYVEKPRQKDEQDNSDSDDDKDGQDNSGSEDDEGSIESEENEISEDSEDD